MAIACLGGALKSKWSDLVLHRPVLESLLRTDSSRLIGHDRGEDIDRGGCVPILGRCLLHLLKSLGRAFTDTGRVRDRRKGGNERLS